MKKYQDRLSVKQQNVRVNEVRVVGEESKVFREAVLQFARSACGIYKVGGRQI